MSEICESLFRLIDFLTFILAWLPRVGFYSLDQLFWVIYNLHQVNGKFGAQKPSSMCICNKTCIVATKHKCIVATKYKCIVAPSDRCWQCIAVVFFQSTICFQLLERKSINTNTDVQAALYFYAREWCGQQHVLQQFPTISSRTKSESWTLMRWKWWQRLTAGRQLKVGHWIVDFIHRCWFNVQLSAKTLTLNCWFYTLLLIQCPTFS